MKIVQEEKGFTVKTGDEYKLFWKQEDNPNRPMFTKTFQECLNYCHAAGLYPHKDTGVLLGLT